MTAPTPDGGLREAANQRCERCRTESLGLGSSALCICGPNVPCDYCGQGAALAAHPPPAEGAQGDGLAEVLATHRLEASGRCTCGEGIGWRNLPWLPAHEAHVAGAVRAHLRAAGWVAP